MRKFLETGLLVALISCAAVWGAQQIRFFQRIPMVFSSLTFAVSSVSNEGRPPRPDTQEFQAPTQSNNEAGGRPQRREMGASSDGWKNILAHCSIFAFMVMCAYYSEQSIRKLASYRTRSLPVS
ncbi:hypothetical protein U14_01273 [Candidatus Moduliflexus flocculans]|uniref:Uncharacterized protein n=1 Tax=Candidatus Moduliflexus flocculans TaxID=1499966 RepID=A0A0S6VRZ5_9BACT|nr:hypothetical protein U14_01273 [Candidatus Moduliflexus flocculans]